MKTIDKNAIVGVIFFPVKPLTITLYRSYPITTIVRIAATPVMRDVFLIFQTNMSFLCTPTPWLTLLLVLGKSRVKQNLC